MANTKFEFDDQQQARSSAWFKHHWDVVHKDFRPRELTGAAVQFLIIPTGIGPNITMQCLWCKADDPKREVVLTVDDDGEFLYSYDENWGRIKAAWEK